MQIKTSELVGQDLDDAVARAQGWTNYPSDSIEHGSVWHCNPLTTPFGPIYDRSRFKPSTNWSEGGPIIEREWITVMTPHGEPTSTWIASRGTKHQFGATPLIAAMRCLVAAKLGDTVDIPDELIS